MTNVFIHIPKTGGSSIRSVCSGSIYTTGPLTAYIHQTASEMMTIIGGEENWKQSFSFSFIRNSWARTVSIYNALYTERPGLDHFKRFLHEKGFQVRSRGMLQPWKLQTDFICKDN